MSLNCLPQVASCIIHTEVFCFLFLYWVNSLIIFHVRMQSQLPVTKGLNVHTFLAQWRNCCLENPEQSASPLSWIRIPYVLLEMMAFICKTSQYVWSKYFNFSMKPYKTFLSKTLQKQKLNIRQYKNCFVFNFCFC